VRDIPLAPLSDRLDGRTSLNGFDAAGFNVNGVHMRGSILAFPDFTLLWNVLRAVDVSPRALAPVHMIRPRTEILLVGTGARIENINPAVYGYMSRRGVAVEVLTTAQAISTFNMLLAEGRAVAVALVSATPVSRDDACLYTEDGAAPLMRPQDAVTAAVLRAETLSADRLLPGKVDPDWVRIAADTAVRELDAAARPPSSTPPTADGAVGVDVPALGVSGVQIQDAPMRREGAAQRATRPSTPDEVLDSIARSSARRSGAK
jgi:NADH dehydrogenase [ubiquinone] 1 alpha subcomplex assembly factor 3